MMITNKPHIMKKLVMIPLIALMVACSATTEDARKQKEEELKQYKTELSDLKKKITKLEDELQTGSTEGIIPVVVTPIEKQLFEHFVDVSGQVEADKNIVVSPETSGKIVSIIAKEGDRVQKGQVLARLNTEAIERSIAEVKINLELATTTFKRQTNLWEQNIGSEMEFLKAKSDKESMQQKLEGLQAQLDMAVVKAPINGVVDEIIQKQGEMANPAAPFARLVNIDQVYITADVSETYLQKVHAGEAVSIEFPVISKTIKGSIFRVSSVIDPGTRTFRIRVNLDNGNNEIKPNMLAVLKINTFSAPDAIVVPSILVKKDFTGEFIFTAVKEDNKWVAKKQYIKSGIKDNNQTQVLEGLAAGDQLITKGYAQVVDGSVINL